MIFVIDDMNCQHCVATVQRIVTQLAPEARVNIDLPRKTVAIDSSVTEDAWLKALDTAGFPARRIE